jgi:type II secretory pathway pseudopilin PulG
VSSSTLLERPKQQRGYLLVELLVSVVIVAAGVLFLVDSMRAPLDTSRRLLETDQALAIVTEVVDRLMVQDEDLSRLRKGSREVNQVTYKWEITELRPVELGDLSDNTSLLSLTINWSRNGEHSLRFPFLWDHSTRQLELTASH